MIHTFIEQTLQPGPAITLTCVSIGHPLPTILWFLDGRPLTPGHQGHYGSNRVSVGSWQNSAGQMISQVNISSVNSEDGGLYACTAENMIGKVFHQARLNIFGPPKERPLRNMTAILGREIVLPCPMSGYPITTTSWTLHSRPLSSTSRRSTRKDGALLISSVDINQDVGRYTCTCSNSHGRVATASFYLIVISELY